ncbi:hypothetical protein ACTXKH_16295 [Brachybacterium tyrofermentans]|uniref:hypothetical protein n=1 Tax=Brachybacterium tyrofermentans TaxID=47848 RepID=UPI003FD3722E
MNYEYLKTESYDSKNYILKELEPSAAKALYLKARSLGADRIAFKTHSRILFSEPREEAVRQLLRSQRPYGHKYQKREGGSWRDISVHRRVGSVNDTVKSIASGSLRDLNASDFVQALREKPEQTSIALIKYFRHATIRYGKHFNARALESDLKIFDSLPPELYNTQLQYVTATIRLYTEMTRAGLTHAIEINSPQVIIDHLYEVISEPSGDYMAIESQVAAQVLLGKLFSLQDRERAALHFNAALALDHAGLIPLFYVDTGVATYFTSAQIASENTSVQLAKITSSINKLSHNKPVSDSCIVISVDARFFRIYAPTLLYYAQQLPNVDYAVLICGTHGESIELMREGLALLRAIDALNHNGAGANLHFYHIEVPEFVVKQKTFFACARFLAAPFFLREFKSITLLDADMSTVADPRPHLRRTSSHCFAAVQSNGFTALSPWRRNLAGNVRISREAQANGVLKDICEYLLNGLKVEASWMLDQNALTYAAERHSNVFHDLSLQPRPFIQQSFRETWESNFGK